MPFSANIVSGRQSIHSGVAGLMTAAVLATVVFASVCVLGLSGLVGGLLLIAVLGIVFAKPECATLVVIFIMFSDSAAVAFRTYGLPAPIAIGSFLLLLLPMLNYIVFRREPVRVDLVFGLMIGYGALLLLSALCSRNPENSAKAITTYVFQGLVLYFLLINTVRSPAILKSAVWTLLLASAMLGTLSLYQNLTHTYDDSYGGFAMTKTLEANGATNNSVADMGNIDTDAKGRTFERHRALGPLGDPNYYGQIMTAVLPLAFVLALSAPLKLERAMGAAACVPIVGAVILTLSRGAALSALLVVACLFLLRYFSFRHAMVVVPILLLAVSITPAFRTRLTTLSGLNSAGLRQADGSVKLRATILRACVEIFWDHPLTGVGAGQSGQYIASYGSTNGFATLPSGIAAHNTYLEQLAETGILGFSCFLAIACVTLRNLLRVRRNLMRLHPEYAHMATALGLTIVAFLGTSIFLHLSYLRYYSLLLGLCGAAVQVYGTDDASNAGSGLTR